MLRVQGYYCQFGGWLSLWWFVLWQAVVLLLFVVVVEPCCEGLG